MDQESQEEKAEISLRFLTKDHHPYPHECAVELFGKQDEPSQDPREIYKERNKDTKVKLRTYLSQFLLDLFLLFPIYTIIPLIESFFMIKYRWSIDQNIGCSQIFTYLKIWVHYMIDIFLTASAGSIYFLMIYGHFYEMNQIYFYWIQSCFLLFFSFHLFILFGSMTTKHSSSQKTNLLPLFSLRRIFNQDRLDSFGLGTSHADYLNEIDEVKWDMPENDCGDQKEEQEKNKKLSEFFVLVQKIAEDFTIDLSLFYFKSMNVQSDIQHRKEHPLSNEEEVEFQKQLLKINPDFNLSGLTDILWEGYEKNSQFYLLNVAQPVYIILLLIKVGLPVWYLLSYEKSFTLDYLILISITGFYIYQFGILFETTSNSDLENRYFIMEELNELINFNSENLKNDEDPKRLVDVTCPLSLETWDSARRICCFLESATTEEFETSCMGLILYYMFILLVCVSFYGEIYIAFSQTSTFLHPVLVIQSTVDLVILTYLFMNRLSSGSDYNDSFSKQLDQIDNLIGIYEDLITTFEYYFAPGFEEKVKNIVYRTLIKKIKSNTKHHLQRDPESKLKRDYQGVEYSEATEKVLIMNQMKNSCSSLEKIKKQIMRDKEERKHLIFGYFDLPFKETLSTLILGLLTFIPTIFKRLELIYNPGATPAPAPAPAGISHFH